jgi:hypothetical protein
MARLYSTNFIAVAGSYNVQVPYHVDDEHLAIVRDFDAYFNSANPVLQLYLVDSITNGTWFTHVITAGEIGGGTSVQWQGRQVFGPGTSFHVYCADSLDVGADMRVSGYLLDYP